MNYGERVNSRTCRINLGRFSFRCVFYTHNSKFKTQKFAIYIQYQCHHQIITQIARTAIHRKRSPTNYHCSADRLRWSSQKLVQERTVRHLQTVRWKSVCAYWTMVTVLWITTGCVHLGIHSVLNNSKLRGTEIQIAQFCEPWDENLRLDWWRALLVLTVNYLYTYMSLKVRLTALPVLFKSFLMTVVNCGSILLRIKQRNMKFYFV